MWYRFASGSTMLCRVLSIALALCGATGCSWFWMEEFIEPRYDVRDKRIFLLPFRDGDLWYGESATSRDLYREAYFQLQECAGTDLVTAPEVEAEVYDYTGGSAPPWTELGRRVEADILLFGDIISEVYETPKVVAMKQGKMHLRFTVWDVELGRMVIEQQVYVTYPKGNQSAVEHLDFEQTEPELRRRLVATAAEEIQHLLCGHTVSKSEMRRQ